MKNPITSIIGLLVALCPILGSFFPEAKAICDTLTAELIGLGFIVAADGVKVPPASLKAMVAAFTLSVAILGLTACSQLKDAAKLFNPFVGAVESQLAELAAGEYKLAVTKDGKVLYEEIIVCTKNEQELTGCHQK